MNWNTKNLTLILILSSIALIYHVNATIEGNYVPKRMFGFQAAILDKGLFICSGTILTKDFVITAAHCFMRGRNISLVNIEIGNYEVSCDGVRNISHILIHPRFSEINRDFDIALLRFERSLSTKDKRWNRVNLPLARHEAYTGKAEAVGWHPDYDADANTTLRLRSVTLDIWDRRRCTSRNIWGTEAYYVFGPLVSERMICAGIPNGPGGTCDLDDGGALIMNRQYLLGVLSWRFDCFAHDKPSVFISMRLMRPWILKVLAAFAVQ